jgi:uncharacterized protein YhaN
MRIERIEIDGFGRFHEERWPFDAGLTVLVGANEAGKTTLLNALRALLFGFEATRDGRTWYPPLGGGRRGGRLVLQTAAGERWTVERHGERGGGGALAVRAPNGNQGGQETLDRLLHGADKDLFTNIFAFGLGELQTFSSLSADGVRSRIYGAGAGLGGTSAIDLERRIRQQLDGTFLPRGSQRPLNQLLARIEELRRGIADLARQPEEHAAAHRERQELQRRADALRAEARETRQRLIRLTHLRDAGPIAAELSDLSAQLAAGDATLDDLAEDAVPVLDRRLAELAEAEAVLATLDDQLTEGRRERAAIIQDAAVLDAADEIAAVTETRARAASAAARRRDLLAAVQRQETALAEQLARAGGWEEARLVELDDSIPSVEATREHEARLGQARARRTEAEQRRRAVRDELDALERETPAEAIEPDTDLEARAAAFRELDGLRAAPAPSAALSVGVAVAAAVLLAIGVLVGAALGAPIPGLVAGAAVASALLLLTRRTGSSVRASSQARRAKLLEGLGLPATAGSAEIGAAWEELVARRARRELAGEGRSRLQARRQELERRDRDLATASEAMAEAEAGWTAWLAERGLSESVSPDAARHLLTAAGQARRAAEDRDHQLRELAALDAEDAAFRERAHRLCVAVGVAIATDEAMSDARIVGIAQRLDHARTEARRAAELDARIGQLEERRLHAAAVVEERRAAVAAHLAATGCADPESLRRRAAAAAERHRLRGAIREHRARLVGIAGGAAQLDGLVTEAGAADPAALEAREIEARETLERLESEERDATSRIGALDAEIRRLEAAEELGARRQELVALEGRAATLAREWAVRALALRLLEETRSRYERERQPDVIRAAESHFERITGGRYARIVAPPGESSVRVETEGGESRVTDELSRGTSEQLYLALRFGLIEEFARHGEPLPVVMDDILVNFDADRAARAASAIRDLASRHQVLYFTCHRWTAELLDPGGDRTLTLE